MSSPGLSVRRRADGGYTISTGDLAEHYVAPRSFKDFTKFLNLMRASARDLRLKIGPPADYPGAWGAKKRWSGDETSPLRTHAGGEPSSIGDGAAPTGRSSAAACSPARKARYRRNLGRHDRRDPGCSTLSVRSGFAPEPLHRHRHERPRFRLSVPGPAGYSQNLVQGRSPGHDLSRFRLNRFHDGSAIVPGPY